MECWAHHRINRLKTEHFFSLKRFCIFDFGLNNLTFEPIKIKH